VLNDAIESTGIDTGVPAHYGDPLAEQRAMADGYAVVDRSNRGVLRITGPDRLSWLHSLTSQDLQNLAPGETAEALILSPQGHVEHHLTLTDDGEQTWLHVEPGTSADLTRYLDSMRFMLRVEVADLTGEYALVSLVGPSAAEQASQGDLVTWKASFGIDKLFSRSEEIPGPRAGMLAYEAGRIEARVPRPGVDTDARTLPHEAGWIGTAVHLNKGCYRGQETVARVQNLGHPPRRLVFLDLDGSVDRLPAPGAPITLGDGTEVGFAGSSARHYERGPIGLGMVKRTVEVDAPLLVDGVAASQEVIVPPDAGGEANEVVRGFSRSGLGRRPR
jgi:tRNA-modifying protein YgfZ